MLLYLEKGAPDWGSTIGAALLCAWAGVFRFFQMRPIAVSDDKIEIFVCGRVWRTIGWSDVQRIEKRAEEALDPGGEAARYRDGGGRAHAFWPKPGVTRLEEF